MHIDGNSARFLGVDFSLSSRDEVISRLHKLSEQEFSYVVTPNVDHIVQLHEGRNLNTVMAFRLAYSGARFRLCDSKILQILARLRGIHLPLVTGSGLTARLFEEGHFEHRKVALVGGDDEIFSELKARYPKVELIQHQPPMQLLRDSHARKEITNFVSESGCHFVLFAVGSPQSEIIAHACRESGRATGVALCIGASIEFLLGRKSRAPRWMQWLALEWLYRLLQEPKRLSRRYLVEGPRIFRIWLRNADFGIRETAPQSSNSEV